MSKNWAPMATWPLLETGRNSVSPCNTPSAAAVSASIPFDKVPSLSRCPPRPQGPISVSARVPRRGCFVRVRLGSARCLREAWNAARVGLMVVELRFDGQDLKPLIPFVATPR
jgi:hypothetical protein